jgi:hypothetical protein
LVHTRFKRFLLIFMMLALPVQAFASVALLGCEFARADKAMPAAMDMIGMDHAMADCHEAPAEQSGAPAVEHQCSHCAACYLAAAFPIPAAVISPVTPIPYSPHLQITVTFSGFVPEGPERPPRTPHA